MCGIAGVINLRNNKIDKEIIPSLIKSIKHRGPDFDDYWVSQNQNVFLINSRLSIQDLSDNGNQPSESSSETHAGKRCYNYHLGSEKGAVNVGGKQLKILGQGRGAKLARAMLLYWGMLAKT